MSPSYHALLTAATRAPSGDNTQPWLFEVDESRSRILVRVDPRQDPSPMNAGQRMARIACGAAVENLLRSARAQGLAARLAPYDPDYAAVIELGPGGERTAQGDVVPPELLKRVTNRRFYDGRPVSPAVLGELQGATPEEEGVRTLWIADAQRLAKLADVISRGDTYLFGDASMRNAFMANVRFDAPPGQEVVEGLSFNSIEASALDRTALRLVRSLPDWVVRAGGMTKAFALHARKLVKSSSGLCVLAVTANPSDGIPREYQDILVGRALQRAWLALTVKGLAAQPMMSLPVLENVLSQGTPELAGSLIKKQVPVLLQSLQGLLPEIGNARPAFLLRFGYAAAPSGRVGRKPLQSVVINQGAGNVERVHQAAVKA